jgi:fucose 4-O-acetylase-like acetyltransferase
VLVACIAITSLGLFALDERGYFWLVVMLTPTALFMLSIADFQGFEVGVQRTLNSGLGIVVGLLFAETIVRIGRSQARPARR